MGGHEPSFQLPRPGDVIAGKYAIVRVIGEGGMGVVFEASHQRLRQPVAIKMLLPDMMKHSVVVTRFEREARAAAQLKGRHVARVMDVDVTPEGLPYMVMELLEGHDLQVELEKRTQFPLEEAVDYVLQTCAAMMEAHGVGIIHRDLKPSNLFLTLDNGARVVKVLDFGISKLANEGDSKLTGSESVIGTALYMSPEQVRSSGTVDVRSDVWALGVILYELISGRPPWIGTPTQVAAAIVSEVPPDLRSFTSSLPEEIVGVVNRALQRDPNQRFPNVQELAFALAPYAKFGSAGRAFAEAIAAGSNRFSIRPPSPSHSQLPPSGPVHSAMARSGMRDGGTSPGWTNHAEKKKTRSRAVLIGLGVALLFGATTAGTVMFLKYRSTREVTSSMPSAAVEVHPSDAPSNETLAPPRVPEPPATGVASATTSAPAPSATDKTPKGKPVPGAKPVVKPPTTEKPAQPPPTQPANPTFL